jgi:hypothetical protein
MSSRSLVTPGMPRIAVVALWLIMTAAVEAQDRLFIGSGEIGAFGRFGERIGDAPGAVHGRFAAGGRYVVWPPQVFDTRTGAAVQMPSASVLTVDPIAPRVFLNDLGQISMWDLDRQILTPLIAVEPHDTLDTLTAAEYAPDTQQLFVWARRLGATTPVMTVIDVTTATEVRTLTLDLAATVMWRITPDGARIVAPDISRSELVLYDGTSGARLATHHGVDFGRPLYDARFERWYTINGHVVMAFDRDLALMATLPLGTGCGDSSMAVSPHTGRLYIADSLGGDGANSPSVMALRLIVIDGASGALIGTRDVTTAAGVPAGTTQCESRLTTVVTAPGAPRGLTGTVTGRDVALRWGNVGDATNFFLEAGTAPGRTDVTLALGATSPVTIPTAPPGTYYLRVRGTNAFGVGQPSDEVVVTVP